jgi:RNA-directed DNA polymerase
MGLLNWLLGAAGGKRRPDPFKPVPVPGRAAAPQRTIAELERRLGVGAPELRRAAGRYHEYTVPKRTGGRRKIAAPEPELKRIQRLILRRVLRRLRAHAAAMAFERGRSIVTHAAAHASKAVVVRIDVKDFFGSLRADQVRSYFRAIGWDDAAADLLTDLCTHRGSLPQGAPTSPRLANLLSHRLDARLSALARNLGAAYTRYADDITYSFEADDGAAVHTLVRVTGLVLKDAGLTMHMKRKLRVRRRHQQQLVTGLVVNEGVRLPRRTRRWLRAVRHHLSTGREATLSPDQLGGWEAFRWSIERPRS